MRERQKRVSGNKVAESQNPLKLLGGFVSLPGLQKGKSRRKSTMGLALS